MHCRHCTRTLSPVQSAADAVPSEGVNLPLLSVHYRCRKCQIQTCGLAADRQRGSRVMRNTERIPSAQNTLPCFGKVGQMRGPESTRSPTLRGRTDIACSCVVCKTLGMRLGNGRGVRCRRGCAWGGKRRHRRGRARGSSARQVRLHRTARRCTRAHFPPPCSAATAGDASQARPGTRRRGTRRAEAGPTRRRALLCLWKPVRRDAQHETYLAPAAGRLDALLQADAVSFTLRNWISDFK